MARLESEAESARSMKEAKYEQFALGEWQTISWQSMWSGKVKKQMHFHSLKEYIFESKNYSHAAKRLTHCTYCYRGRCLRRVLLQQWGQGLCFAGETNCLLEQINSARLGNRGRRQSLLCPWWSSGNRQIHVLTRLQLNESFKCRETCSALTLNLHPIVSVCCTVM